ncbi:YfhO family protein [Candidatus Gottesmanbacteria bacterium]|nr:YfhO family protein [Candidatus Gottesmanbacteria bacterium]
MKNWKHFLTDKYIVAVLISIVLAFYWPLIFGGKIPIPADTIVGMYYPWKDQVWDLRESGIPVKNFLITDPVRQQYVWRKFAIGELKKGSLPLWNPYSFSGTPLLANIQSAPFYPMNILSFLLPFDISWGIQILFQSILLSVFLYLYLRGIRLSMLSSFFGAFAFTFSGFTIAWLEWNTVIQVVVWLPIILLAVEKLTKKFTWRWFLVFVGGTIFQILAGHLQILFYSQIVVHLYILAKMYLLFKENKANRPLRKLGITFLSADTLAILITSFSWIPVLQFIALSARNFDQGSFLKPGWFIPWENLLQFFIPDFFGNPVTLNYWGVWNYAEFVGYIGIVPILFALYSIFYVKNKRVLFFSFLAVFSLLFALPTPLSSIPYSLHLPFLSSSQPTRLIFIVDFALSILAAFGIEQFQKSKYKRNIVSIILLVGIFFLIVFSVLYGFTNGLFGISEGQILIAKRNTILPMLLFIFSSLILLVPRVDRTHVFFILIMVTGFDLFRFGWKFTPFTEREWIFPRTKVTDYLETIPPFNRIQSIDRRIMPPNFSVYYKIFDVAGYDPLYIQEYGQYVAAWERNSPDITPGAFNRILTPQNYEHFLGNLLGIGYILSLQKIQSPSLELVFKEGETYVYRNTNAFPRAFIVYSTVVASGKKDSMEKMYKLGKNLRNVAVVEKDILLESPQNVSTDQTVIVSYEPNVIRIRVKVSARALLVFTDPYYPTWQVSVDGFRSEMLRINFTFRGVVVPNGEHIVEFHNHLI